MNTLTIGIAILVAIAVFIGAGIIIKAAQSPKGKSWWDKYNF